MIENQAGSSAKATAPSVMSALPPSYESATYGEAYKDRPLDQKQPIAIAPPALSPPPTTVPTTQAGAITVYHYVNPVTQHRVDSLLPPDHPEMMCLQYGHTPRTRFGVAGILAAIFWFPLGLGCMLLDRDVQCTRCKKIIKSRFGEGSSSS